MVAYDIKTFLNMKKKRLVEYRKKYYEIPKSFMQ